MMCRIISLILIVLITGCASLNSEYDCPRARGLQCKSLREVDMLIGAKRVKDGAKHYFDKTYPQNPYRTSERVSEIWYAPYRDSHNVYHEARKIHRVKVPSRWEVGSSYVK